MADPVMPSEMQVGSTGSVKVTIDTTGAPEDAVPVVKWTSTGSMLVEANPEDPTVAKIWANVPGLGTVRSAVDFNGTHREMTTDFMVIEPSFIPSNTIEVSID